MKMCSEAADELAQGDTSWKEANPNVLLLAAFGMLSSHLSSKLIKPLWFFASSLFVGVVAYVINLVASAGSGL